MADTEQGTRTLRPRKSFLSRNKNLVEPDKLRSPLKLLPNVKNVNDARGGKDLFPPSPEIASFKKLATSLTGAFGSASKGRNSTGGSKGKVAAKKGFDLSDWNEDLAAIASKDSSIPSSPNKTNGLPRLAITAFNNFNYGSDDLITPTSNSFPTISIPSNPIYTAALELPVSIETRRRKSDEMEDQDRVQFGNGPIRKDLSTHSHTRSHSLAHAHMLRSSRSLSHHASVTFDSPRQNSSLNLNPSTSNLSHSSNYNNNHAPTFSNPFASPFQDLDPTTAPPPAKKISLLSPEQRREEKIRSEENVFGGNGLNLSVGPGKKVNRAKSLTRGGNNLGGSGLPLPSSNSHPGWVGDGFDIIKSHGNGNGMTGGNGNSSGTGELTRGRSKTSSSATLDTLDEEGMAVDHFSPLSRAESKERNPTIIGKEEILSTPRRRSSDGGFNLLGGKVLAVGGRRASLGVEFTGSMGNRRSLSDLDTSMEEEEEFSSDESNSPQKQSTPIGGRSRKLGSLQFREMPSPIYPLPEFSLPSRRATSLDSLFLASIKQGNPILPLSNSGTGMSRSSLIPSIRDGGRKRNASGTLLGGLGTSNLSATPLVGNSSPEPWNVRDNQIGMDEDEEEEELLDQQHLREMDWGGNISSAPPSFTDGTASTSSSLSTSLSSHAEGEPIKPSTGRSPSQSSLSLSNSGSRLGLSTSTFFTPQSYQHVRPLQAAFMSTGLVSKRSRARNDSGIGLGLASAYRSNSTRLVGQDDSFDTSIPLDTPMLPESITNLPILNPLRMSTNSIMPDTPVKKSNSFSHASNPELSSLLLEPKKEEARDEMTGIIATNLPTPAQQSSSPILPLNDSLAPSPTEINQSRNGSPNNVSPTIYATRSDIRSNSQIQNSRQTLFRRRSSGQIGSNSLGVGMNGRSGSSTSSSGSGVEIEPMTPTKSVGINWTEGTQLISTPLDSPNLPATPCFPGSYTLPIASTSKLVNFPPPLATPHLRQSYPFSNAGLRQHLQESGRLGGRTFSRERDSRSSLGLDMADRIAPTWFESNYTVLSSLGNGEFSEAFEVVDKKRGGVFAVKRTKNAFGGPKDRLRRFEEVDILRIISDEDDRSPHLIHLVDAWEQNGHLFIQSELCENGNLSFFLEEFGKIHEVLDEIRVWKIFMEISRGLQFLHQRNVIHLDLKPANIFITERGHLKIGDFGLATRWPRADAMSIVRGAAVQSPGWKSDEAKERIWNGEEGERRSKTKSSGDEPEDLEREGDREYIAPEIMGGRYGKEADIFSLGLIVLEAAANVILPDNGVAWHKLRSNDFSDVDLSRLSHELVILITALLETSPDIRIPIDQVMKHAVITRFSNLLNISLELEESASEKELPILGAILPEVESFLFDSFSSIYSYEGDTSFSGDHSFGGDGDDEDSIMGEI